MTEKNQERIEGIRQFQAKGRCTLCYQTSLASGELVVRPRNEYTDTHIKCLKCSRWRANKWFKVSKSNLSGYEHVCRSCSKLWERYRLTHAKYVEMHDNQGGRCAICPLEIELYTKDSNIDHDHSCCNFAGSCGRCIRGLLCKKCNTGIGMLRDDVNIIRRAAGYIENGGI